MNKIRWKAFEISEIFDEIYMGKSSDSGNLETGSVPLIGRSANHNGYENNYSISHAKINQAPLITVSLIGRSTAFYQEFDLATSQNILILKHKNLNKQNGLFLVNSINNYLKSFLKSYGLPGSLTRMSIAKIMLPVNSKNEPDWEFMEDYIRDKYVQIMKTYKVPQKHKIIDRRGLNEIEWTTVSLNDLFDVSIGNNIDGNKIDKYTGNIPYITRKESNNGIDGFLNKSFEEKYYSEIEKFVITIGNETAKPFVQRYSFYTGTKVNILTPKEEKINNFYTMQFICEMIEKQRNRFSYSFSANSTRLKLQKIKLPTKGEHLDFMFMEQYMKRIENKVLEKVQDNF